MRLTQRLGLLMLAAVTPFAGAQGPPPANVRLDAVVEEIVARQREAAGQVVSLRRSAVATQEAGLVLELDLEPGDSVERGQVIARLDDSRASLEDLGLGGAVPLENIGGRAEIVTFSLDGSTSWNPVSWWESLRGDRAGTSLRPDRD